MNREPQESRDFAALTLQIPTPKWGVGTKFDYRGREAEVVGLHIEHDTDTGETKLQYRIAYTFGVQAMTAVVPRSTVDRAKLAA